jgi:hypothetical protein
MRRRVSALLAIVLLSGCSPMNRRVGPPPPPPPVVMIDEGPEWQRVASGSDQDRIADVDRAWAEALDQALNRRTRRLVEEEGDLLDPGAALPKPALTPGSYWCRVVKLGMRVSRPRARAFVAYKPFYCYVEAEGDLLTIVKQTGSQRPAGRIYPDDRENRMIFLGAMGLGDETEPLPYGEDPERDMAGVVERIGPFRWRLVVPYPRSDALLDVLELTPVLP